MSRIDLIFFLILGMNPDEDSYIFILNYRYLKYKNRKLNNDQQHYLWFRIGNKIDMKEKVVAMGINLMYKKFLLQFLRVENL